MTAPLFWASAAALAAARVGDSLTVAGEEAHHAVAVKRLRVGESALVSDAAGRLAHTSVSRVVAGRAPELTVLVESLEDVPIRVPRLILAQALTKQRRDEAAVAAATGLGVDAIIPWQADRSVTRWLDGAAAKAAKGVERWQTLARAEAKVARRAWVPEVLPAVDSPALAGRLAGAVESGAVAIVLHEQAEAGLAGALGLGGRTPADAGTKACGPTDRDGIGGATAVYLITGPEGGIGPDELDALKQAGCATARLGPEILRAGLAGPAALAVASHLLARWPL
ncbi:MAG: 16S rRNA (uracil(1498)-N(3))-methyltransferase [Bifidobacteriaceae bacterium]|nr:16S rRNA (uracil(1498)-N(3))-methyltransferase [Bifidobacteriaceae bacterium]